MPEFSELQNLLKKYFPDRFTEGQISILKNAFNGYLEWNEKINVISRKDIENLAIRHFLHSFAIAKVIDFLPGTKVLDAGTGGGFPGIPLAILFPDTHFQLVDSRSKKITVVDNIRQHCTLKNVQPTVQRVEQLGGQYDFVVSRAVAAIEKFLPWVEGQIKRKSRHPLKNGILYLRGGDIEAEMKALKNRRLAWKVYPISDWFEEEFFEEKSLLHIWWKK